MRLKENQLGWIVVIESMNLYQPATLERMLDSTNGVSIHGCLSEDMASDWKVLLSIMGAVSGLLWAGGTA